MKLIYIEPKTELVVCQTNPLLDGSANTEWNMGEIGSGTTDPIGEGDDDPNSDAKQYFGLWEE